MPELSPLLEYLTEPTTWRGTLAAAGVAALLGALLYRVIVQVMRRVTAQRPLALAVLSRTAAPGAWLLPMVAVQAVWSAAPARLAGLDTGSTTLPWP
jgi:hypothetical protein